MERAVCRVRVLPVTFLVAGHMDGNYIHDGASSQFKQKYMFTNLTFLQEIYDVSITWNFFATSHGKGAVDGIGGDVKRRVWLANLTGDRASDAESFARIAVKHCKKLRFSWFWPAK